MVSKSPDKRLAECVYLASLSCQVVEWRSIVKYSGFRAAIVVSPWIVIKSCTRDLSPQPQMFPIFAHEVLLHVLRCTRETRTFPPSHSYPGRNLALKEATEWPMASSTAAATAEPTRIFLRPRNISRNMI